MLVLFTVSQQSIGALLLLLKVSFLLLLVPSLFSSLLFFLRALFASPPPIAAVDATSPSARYSPICRSKLLVNLSPSAQFSLRNYCGK